MWNSLMHVADLPVDWKEIQAQLDTQRAPDKYADFLLNVLAPPNHISEFASWETSLIVNPKLLQMFVNHCHALDIDLDPVVLNPDNLRQQIKVAIRHAQKR